jgi:hypothetical protein
LTSHEHPGPEQLLASIEGRLAGHDARRVKEHLEAGCPACDRALAVWKRLLAGLARGPEAATSEASERRILELGASRMRPALPRQRIRAVLEFDSRVAANRRGAPVQQCAPLQLQFAAGGGAIDLVCAPADDDPHPAHWSVVGQLLGLPPVGLSWTFIAEAGGARWEAEAGPLGDFALYGLAPGRWELSLEDVEREIVLGAVILPNG